MRLATPVPFGPGVGLHGNLPVRTKPTPCRFCAERLKGCPVCAGMGWVNAPIGRFAAIVARGVKVGAIP
jgi:hypothetical protein